MSAASGWHVAGPHKQVAAPAVGGSISMATNQQATADQANPAQTYIEANVALVNTIIEAGYKAQSRGLNVARVFVEAAGRQQENNQRLAQRLADPSLPWYSPERYSVVFNTLVENQNEALRIGREYIDEFNAAAAESRTTVETIVKHAGKAREAGQHLQGKGFQALRRFTGNVTREAATA